MPQPHTDDLDLDTALDALAALHSAVCMLFVHNNEGRFQTIHVIELKKAIDDASVILKAAGFRAIPTLGKVN